MATNKYKHICMYKQLTNPYQGIVTVEKKTDEISSFYNVAKDRFLGGMIDVQHR